jgi:hypothetical protein
MVELAIFIFLAVWHLPQAPKLIAIYDARLSPKPIELSPTDMALARRAAHKAWGDQENCDSGFAELDVAYGSFTKAQAKERAILYRNCTTGPYFSSQGIAIVEGDKLVTQVAYDDAWDNAIGTLPDINKNGLSEIILASGGLTQGYSWRSVSIIELSSDGVKKLGNLELTMTTVGRLRGEKPPHTSYMSRLALIRFSIRRPSYSEAAVMEPIG